MNLLHPLPESAMVAAFLKAEFSSPRFRVSKDTNFQFSNDLKRVMQRLSVSEKTITEPDLQNEHDNALRTQVLGDYRGYRQNREIFTNFPNDLSWYEAELTRDDVTNLHYVDYSYWNELSDHTHLVKDAVKNIQKGKIVFDVPNDNFFDLAEKIRQGQTSFEPIIVWGKDKHSPLTILEGHVRATALGLAGKEAPESIKVIVGLRHETH